MVTADIKSRISNYKMNIHFHVLPRFTNNFPLVKIDVSTFRTPVKIQLTDSYYNKPQRIDAISDSKIFYELMRIDQNKLLKLNLRLHETYLG